MRVTYFDHFGSHEEPQTIEGNPMQIEQQLREHFHGALGHIPFGDLYEMIRTLRAMTGLEISIDEEPKPIRRKPLNRKAPVADPRPRELYLPFNGDDNL